MTRRRALLAAVAIVVAVAAAGIRLYLWSPAWGVMWGVAVLYVLLLGPLDEYDPAYPLVQRWRAFRGIFYRRRRRR